MSLNPRLQTAPVDGRPAPVVFTGEFCILTRDGMELEFELPTTGRKMNCRGVLFLSNVRMVFMCDKPTPEFSALDMPLAYVRTEKINQPWFGCNNITANVFSVCRPPP
uniref:GRAM domain-containing protein n=1 Tax=Pyramimonas obovata TaxID=1411642 RepID=A0A7S0WI61_9CHLO